MHLEHFHKWQPPLNSFVFILIRHTHALILKQNYPFNSQVVTFCVHFVVTRQA